MKPHSIVVLGARRSNAPEHWDDPRIAFLDGADVLKRGLPGNAEVVIFTKFLAHSAFGKAMDEARHRGLRIIPGLTTTGVLKQTLSQLLALTPERSQPEPPSTESARMPTPTAPAPFTKGEISHWVRAFLEQRPDAPRQDVLAAGMLANYPKSALNAAYYRIKTAHKTKGRSSSASAKAVVNSRLVDLIDEAISALQLVREEAVAHAKQSAKLEKLVAAIKGFDT